MENKIQNFEEVLELYFDADKSYNKHIFKNCINALNIWFDYLRHLNSRITDDEYDGKPPVREEAFMRIAISENLKLKNGPFLHRKTF